MFGILFSFARNFFLVPRVYLQKREHFYTIREIAVIIYLPVFCDISVKFSNTIHTNPFKYKKHIPWSGFDQFSEPVQWQFRIYIRLGLDVE